MSKNKNALGVLMLLLAALIWGSAFSAQSIGARYVNAYTFLAIRSWISFIAMIPVVCFFKSKKSSNRHTTNKSYKKTLIIASLCSGFFLFIASAMQQIGIKESNASKAGFITALYVIFVPIISIIFFKMKEGIRLWISVVLSVAGLFLLCIHDGFNLEYGDAILLFCAFLFALQIITVAHFVKKVDVLDLSIFQFLVVAIFSSIVMIAAQKPSADMILKAMPALLFVGIFSGACGYTLQNVGQQYVRPSIASLLMSLESVFSAIFAWIILGEMLGSREMLGAILMFSAIILAQLPIKGRE